tara:strand:+ start:48560 stop:50320 length:1761 start_codon:yes stop_codon:yes gene_type:complete
MPRNKIPTDKKSHPRTGTKEKITREKSSADLLSSVQDSDSDLDYSLGNDDSSFELKDKPEAIPLTRSDEYTNSVFKVTVKTTEFDFDKPWNPPEQRSWGGSGFAVSFQDKIFLLTNAHVATRLGRMKVRLADTSKEYDAKAILIEDDCDLAILEVKDNAFLSKIEPLELGGMVKREQELAVHGFPMGGEELCITKGTVSRIEVDTYVQANTNLLQAQVSAAINPGNSGGPVIANGKVVGVAFQGNSSGEGLGYIIPTPIITHLLTEALDLKNYKGFPDLNFKYQELKNDNLRKRYGMAKDETGIRVRSVPKLSAARDLLKANDIILSIDGHTVSNDGTISTRDIKRVDLDHAITSHFIGDNVQFSIIRDKERLEIDVTLKHRSSTTKKVQHKYEEIASYFFASGIALCNLTDNLFESNIFGGGDLINLTEKEKRKPGEEIVFIKEILACEHNEGYGNFTDDVVKKINGKRIHNLRDAIKAVESNKSDMHEIETKGGHMLVVPNLDSHDHKRLLKSFYIYRDRSPDLKTDPIIKAGCPEAYSQHHSGKPKPLLLQFTSSKDKSKSSRSLSRVEGELALVEQGKRVAL